MMLVTWAMPAHAQRAGLPEPGPAAADAGVLLAQAILAYDDRRYDQAMQLLERVLERDPRNARALYYQGLVHLARQRADLAIEPLEKARAIRPGDVFIRYQLGVAYFTLGLYDQADPILSEVFAEQPGLDALGYYVGFLRYRKQDYAGAVTAFEAGRVTDPNLRQLAGFYKGLALGVLGLSDQAIAALNDSLTIQGSDPLTGSAVRLRDALSLARSGAKRFRGQITVGGFYNDNVAINPNPSSDPFAEAVRSNETRAGGLTAGAMLEYSWFRHGPMEATASYSFFSTFNQKGRLWQFNVMDHQVAVAGYYRGTLAGKTPYQLALSYSYDYLFLGYDGFLARQTATFSPTVVMDTLNLTTAVFRFQRLDFYNALGFADFVQRFPATQRDGYNWMGGFTHFLRFEGDKHLVSLGYQYDVEDTVGVDFSYSGNKLLTGGMVTLPWGRIRLRYDYQVHWRQYRSKNVTFPFDDPGQIRRIDIQQNHTALIEKPLPYNFTLTLQYQRTQNDSNLAIYGFTQNIYTATTTWNF
jgi:tetratricopeptide (TPR) repeat protein